MRILGCCTEIRARKTERPRVKAAWDSPAPRPRSKVLPVCTVFRKKDTGPDPSLIPAVTWERLTTSLSLSLLISKMGIANLALVPPRVFGETNVIRDIKAPGHSRAPSAYSLTQRMGGRGRHFHTLRAGIFLSCPLFPVSSQYSLSLSAQPVWHRPVLVSVLGHRGRQIWRDHISFLPSGQQSRKTARMSWAWL